ncbi:hypothetical protein PGT21_009361 [Puccinia graminis f. sp. tritici]|uniref:Uncharacterized protein n=1 Tax=Puccinia graminis f. sp. tritici TaxID=56615 RepID=A0A5B0LLU8_PUCGR|nr:hypothetical protein PGT21_009361 [Puccinia graminis f. sp. tritici]
MKQPNAYTLLLALFKETGKTIIRKDNGRKKKNKVKQQRVWEKNTFRESSSVDEELGEGFFSNAVHEGFDEAICIGANFECNYMDTFEA